MSNEPMIPLNEMKEMASAVCKSGLFAMTTPEAALTLMLICQSEGLHPMQALKRYHIIKGRPSMRADAMLAEFQRGGGAVEWIERTDESCKAKFSHAQGGTVEICWTMEQAKKAGLTANDTWRRYPRQMLTARTISEGVRTVLPGVIAGIYTPEEISDFDTEAPKMKKATPKEPAPEPTPTEKAKALCAKIAEEREKPAEFEPEDATVIPEPAPEAKAAERPISAKQVADELKKIRELAISAGAANREEIRALIAGIINRDIETATSLSDAERKQAIEALEAM